MKDINQILTFVITIVGFMVGFQFFTAKPSLSINVKSSSTGYHIGLLKQHYTKNNINFPTELEKNESLKNFFHFRGGTRPRDAYAAVTR